MNAYQELEYRGWELVKRDPQLEAAVNGAIIAGRMLHEAFGTGTRNGLFIGLEKPEQYRARSEKLIADALAKASQDRVVGKTIFPNTDHAKGKVWLLNGIDGFVNFTRGRPLFCVTAAQVENGDLIKSLVYDPFEGVLYYAARGEGSYVNGQPLKAADTKMSPLTLISYAPLFVRSDHPEDEILVNAVWRTRENLSLKHCQVPREDQRGAHELCQVAGGRLDGVVTSWTNIPNLGAGALVASEAGVITTDILNRPWKPGVLGIFAALPKIHPILVAEAQRHVPKEILQKILGI